MHGDSYIDGLAQDCSNSSALAIGYCSNIGCNTVMLSLFGWAHTHNGLWYLNG